MPVEKDYFVDAIESLLPGAKMHASSGGEKADSEQNFIIDWLDERTQPTVAEIQTEMDRLKTEWAAQEYARNRELEYPSTGDQLDMMYKDNKNSTTTHADAVEAVKTKWPKDNSGPVE